GAWGARAPAVLAILESGPNEAATTVLAALDERDAYLVESIIWRGDNRPNEIARALLPHRNGSIRGSASLALHPTGRGNVPTVPEGWYEDWAAAFEVAPLGD